MFYSPRETRIHSRITCAHGQFASRSSETRTQTSPPPGDPSDRRQNGLPSPFLRLCTNPASHHRSRSHFVTWVLQPRHSPHPQIRSVHKVHIVHIVHKCLSFLRRSVPSVPPPPCS